MFSTIRNSTNLMRVALVLARHDALFLLELFGLAPSVVSIVRLIAGRKAGGRPGERLAQALTEAGPSFIKMGQAFATRSDLLGEEMCEDLSKLQDRLPPFPTDQARDTIERELGQTLEKLFFTFDDTPIAAASIAQVHFAVTESGQKVAVKVLRPHIEQAFQRDINLLYWIAELVENLRPELRRLKPVQVIKKLAETVEMEMDLRFEAAAADEMRENFRGDPDFFIPEIDWSRTSQRVMVTERLDGFPLDDRDALSNAGLIPSEVLTKAANATFLQVFRDGFFHADVHPGNLFVMPDGAIGVVDFGIMGRIDVKTRRYLAEMLLAFLTRNYRRAAEVHFEAGWVPPHRSVEIFTQACRSIAEPILDKPQNEISIAQLLGQLFKITETFEMETQPQLLLLQKTLLVAEGTARKLDPEANMWMLARPLIEGWMRANLGPEARVKNAVEGAAETLSRLPRIMDTIEESAAIISSGEIRLRSKRVVSHKNLGENTSRIMSWICIALLGSIVLLTFS